MKILFLDHIFHAKTKSTQFFIELLKPIGDLDIIHIDPSNAAADIARAEARMDQSSFDVVIVWQLEILALLALSRGTPTIIVPMYDGCADMPAEHWALLEHASIVQFSRTLHVRTRAVVPSQLLVRYFLDPAAYPAATFETRRALFWQRRPKDISVDAVIRLLGADVDKFHVHLADDFGAAPPVSAWAGNYVSSSSDWFEDQSGFDDIISQSNILICPRLSEGIGMFMLQGMARGICVIAPATPTHCEYIAHDINGLLFDPKSDVPLDLSRCAELGRAARRGCERGILSWRAQQHDIISFVKRAAATNASCAVTKQDAAVLCASYFQDMDAYLRKARKVYARSGYSRIKPVLGEAPYGEVQLRSRMNRVPGWSRLKHIIPNDVKRSALNILNRFVP